MVVNRSTNLEIMLLAAALAFALFTLLRGWPRASPSSSDEDDEWSWSALFLRSSRLACVRAAAACLACPAGSSAASNAETARCWKRRLIDGPARALAGGAISKRCEAAATFGRCVDVATSVNVGVLHRDRPAYTRTPAMDRRLSPGRLSRTGNTRAIALHVQARPWRGIQTRWGNARTMRVTQRSRLCFARPGEISGPVAHEQVRQNAPGSAGAQNTPGSHAASLVCRVSRTTKRRYKQLIARYTQTKTPSGMYCTRSHLLVLRIHLFSASYSSCNILEDEFGDAVRYRHCGNHRVDT